MDRFTRKELKSDKFAEEVGQTIEFLEVHRRQAYIVGAAIVLVILIGVGAFQYLKQQRGARQEALREAIRTYDAPIGEANPLIKTFATQQEKDAAVQETLQGLIEKYPGSDEAIVATYYLGVAAANKGLLDEAEKHFRGVLDKGNKEHASQAAYTLAQILNSRGETAEAEQLLRNLIEKPTVLVSKEQATIALAQMLAERDPAEARKLLEPLRTERSAVSRAAISLLGQLER